MAGPHALPHQTEPPVSTDVRDLVPGLLVFFARPSLLQTWAEAFGHQWRHVGVTIQTDAGLMVASYGPRKCFRLDDPFEIMDAYNRVGVARVLYDDAEIERLHEFCAGFRDLPRSAVPYTFSGILVGPIHLAARRMRPGVMRSMLMWFVYLYCMMQQAWHGDRKAYGCSTFSLAAVLAARTEPIRLPLSAHPEDEAAYASESTRRDEVYARWLCGPTELWDAISPSHRVDLDLTNLSAPHETAALASAPDEHVAPGEDSRPVATVGLGEWSADTAVVDLRGSEGGFDALARNGPRRQWPARRSDLGRAA